MKIIIISIIVVVGLSALFLYWSNKALVLTTYKLESAKIVETLKITQVSDLQSSYFGKNQKNLLKVVGKTSPDVIVFTGDLMDRNHIDYEAAISAMEGLVKIAPVFYVNGNHELALPESDTSRLYKTLSAMGVHVLFDRAEDFITKGGQKVNFIGISEYTIYGNKFDVDGLTRKPLDDMSAIEGMIETLTAQVAMDELNVLLVHEPQYVKSYDDSKIDYIFSGHAHGGQIRMPFTEGLYAPGQGIMPKLTSGVHKYKHSALVISRGLGNSVFPFRIFNRPEIVYVVIGKE